MDTRRVIAMAESFEALGNDVLTALSRDPETDADVSRESSQVELLLAERDALLAELTAALAESGAPVPADSFSPVAAALSKASTSTATLIAQVADRTDALRTALREMSRSAQVVDAYQSPGSHAGLINARR
jgi:hypothetical protein